MQLENYRIYMKLMIDGMPSKPFSATTLQYVPARDQAQSQEALSALPRAVDDALADGVRKRALGTNKPIIIPQDQKSTLIVSFMADTFF